MHFFVKYIHPWLPAAALSIAGLFMILKPNLESELHGRQHRALTTLIYRYVWSVPVGVILLLIASYLIYTKIQQNKEQD